MVCPNHYGIFDLDRYRLPYNPTSLYLYIGLPALILMAAALLLPCNGHWAPVAAMGLACWFRVMAPAEVAWSGRTWLRR